MTHLFTLVAGIALGMLGSRLWPRRRRGFDNPVDALRYLASMDKKKRPR